MKTRPLPAGLIWVKIILMPCFLASSSSRKASQSQLWLTTEDEPHAETITTFSRREGRFAGPAAGQGAADRQDHGGHATPGQYGGTVTTSYGKGVVSLYALFTHICMWIRMYACMYKPPTYTSFIRTQYHMDRNMKQKDLLSNKIVNTNDT